MAIKNLDLELAHWQDVDCFNAADATSNHLQQCTCRNKGILGSTQDPTSLATAVSKMYDYHKIKIGDGIMD